MQGNSSFEVRNHSKGRDYMEVQLKIDFNSRWPGLDESGLKWTAREMKACA